MEEEKLLLHKNKDLIEITTNKITKQQLKAFNYVAYKARKELKKDHNQREFYFNYQDIEKAIDSNKTNNKFIYNTLERLRKTDVYLIKDSRNWANFSLISEVKRIEDKLQIQLPSTMCDCLLEKSYTTLDLKTIRSFKSKYTILFYELYQKYKDINFPILAISDFKKICGIENKKTFKDFYNVQVKILKPTLKELAKKENIFLLYKLSKKGKAYSTIQFFISKNTDNFKLDNSELSDTETKKMFDEFKKNNADYKNLLK